MTNTDYHHRATRHRPTNPNALAAECLRLAASGLKPRDIAQALAMPLVNVLAALKESKR